MYETLRGFVASVCISLVVVIAVFFGLVYAANSVKRSSEKVDGYFTITDKDSYNTILATGKSTVIVKHYEVTIDMDGEPYDVSVSAAEYQELNIGDEVLCTVYYSTDNIITDVILGREPGTVK